MQIVRSTPVVVLGALAVSVGTLVSSFGLVVMTVQPTARIAVQVALSAALAAAGWLLCVRPRLLVSDFGVAVVNPLRTTFVAWTDLDSCGVGDTLWIRDVHGQVLEVYAVRTDPDRRDRDLERLLGTLRRRGWRARRLAALPAAPRRPRLPVV